MDVTCSGYVNVPSLVLKGVIGVIWRFDIYQYLYFKNWDHADYVALKFFLHLNNASKTN